MNDPSTQNKDPACSAYADQDERGMKPLTLDPDEYREYLEGFDLDEARKNELLAVLWNIMRTFVEIGFGLDSVQTFSTATDGRSGDFAGQDSGNMPGQIRIPTQFNKAAIEHAANKEEKSSCAKE